MITLPWVNCRAFLDAGVRFAYVQTTLYYEITFYVGSVLYESKVDITTPKNSTQTLFETTYIPLASSQVITKSETDAVVVTPDVIYQLANLADNGVTNAAVSATLGAPRNFRWSPPAGQTWYIESLTILVNDNASFPNNGFGAVAALVNGVQINLQSKGQVTSVLNLQNNYDIIKSFTNDSFSSVSTALLSTDRTYRGTLSFDNRITLRGDASDYIELKVRDNLSQLTGLFLTAKVWRVAT